MREALDATDARMAGLEADAIPTEAALNMQNAGEDMVLFKNVLPATPSGKIELRSSYLADKYGQGQAVPTLLAVPAMLEGSGDGPLQLVSPASDKRTSSTFGGLKYSDEVWLEVHPQDAASRNLSEGGWARMWNGLGEVHLPVKITERVRPGVVCSYKGSWMRTSDNGQTVSALAPTHKADLAHGACYNDTRVDVAPWQPPGN